MKKISSIFYFIILLIIFFFQLSKGYSLDYKFYGHVQPEISSFINGKGKHNQPNEKESVYFNINFISYIQDDLAKITINPIARYDHQDNNRTYIDLNRLKYEYFFDNVTFKIGNEIVFWGVNESFHVVDIINQSNITENLAGTKKLGQPMLALSLYEEIGDINLYIMPYFRERIFPGNKGRPRYAVEIDEDAVTYESSKKEKRIDLAIRYSKVIEDFDIGFSHFHGNARDPELNINQSTLKLNPYYPILTQTSMDIQATKKSWLYKLEALTAKIQSERHVRAAGGFEYTFYGIKDTSQDLGIVAEYLFDDRNSHPFNNEVALAIRWTKNDISSTALLAGANIDLRGNSNQFFCEYEKRLKDDIKLFVDLSMNGHIDSNDFTYAFKDDSNLTIKIAKYF